MLRRPCPPIWPLAEKGFPIGYQKLFRDVSGEPWVSLDNRRSHLCHPIPEEKVAIWRQLLS